LKHVARLAGVSTATVARVIHNSGYVADETRRDVEAAIAKAGYRLNVVAQGLRKQQTRTIGQILNGLSPNPFFANVALGVEQEAERNGYSVLLYNSQGDPEREQRGVETFLSRRVDALLFTTPTSPQSVQTAIDAGLPVVQVERTTPVASHAIIVDNRVGAMEAVRHLLDLGHRRIGFIGVDTQYLYARRNWGWDVEVERFQGFVDAMQSHGIEINPDYVQLGRYGSSVRPSFVANGYAMMQSILAARPLPTAVLAAADMFAAGALQALYQENLRVPNDLSLIGFDNTFAPQLTPSLTTVELPMLEMGRAAVRIALDQLDDSSAFQEGYRVERLVTHLVRGESTSRVRHED
jgi:LacI family transcriptional regulator